MDPALEKKLRLEISHRILNKILPFIVCLTLVFLLSGMLDPPFNWGRYSITIVILIMMTVALILNLIGKTELAAVFYTLLLALVILLAMFRNGGTQTSSYLGFAVILTSMVLFYRLWIPLASYLFLAAVSFLVIILQNRGILPEPPPPLSAGNYTLAILFLFGFLMVIVYAAFRQLIENVQSRQKQADDLESQKRLTQTYLNAMSDAIITIDPGGHILRMNRASERLLDSAGETKKEHFFDCFSLGTAEGTPYRIPLDLCLPIREPNLILYIKGTKIPVVLSGDPIMSHQGVCEGIVVSIRDVTEERELQNQLLQTQKMEAIGQLASGVAHDFNNMLGGILIASEHLEDSLKGEDLEMVKIIQSSGERASRLARQLLDFTRKGKVISTSLDMHEVIKETLAILKQTLNKSILLESRLVAEKHYVVGDDNQIINALINMAVNSSHAMPSGGKLLIQTSDVYLSERFCSNSLEEINPGDYLRIDIIDNGTGIPEEYISRIFDPFFTSKEKGEGTGLGLAAVKTTLQAHSGFIRVYSDRNKGTTFNLYIPISDLADPSASPASGVKIGEGQKILLVDDEEIIRITVKAMLENLGYSIQTATNGRKALEILKIERPDLVILDMIMPEMNGRLAFKEISEKYPGLPVILASGFTKEEDVADMKRKGLQGFIQKPYSRREISLRLYNYFHKNSNVEDSPGDL